MPSNPQNPTDVTHALERAMPIREFRVISTWLRFFYSFQFNWLLDWTRFAALVKSRQIGASHTYAAAAVLWAMLGETTAIVSVGQTEADEFLRFCKKHVLALTALGSRWSQVTRDAATRLEFATGGRILSLPSTSGARGFSGNVILDEFAYHEHPKEVWDGAGGAVTRGKSKMRILSTPNGVGNLFYELCTRPPPGFRVHAVTIDQARAAGMKVDEADLMTQARGDERVYDQLFRCKFLDGEQQYIPSALIDASIVDTSAIWEGSFYAGLDVGRKNDLTCLVIVAVDAEGVHWVQTLETRKRTSEEDLHALCALALGPKWRCQRVCVDATGIGAFPSENLQKRFGRSRIEPVDFTLQSKEDMATTLYQRFADKKLKTPREAKDLRDDVASLRRIITSAGNVRYDAPTTERGHADRAWALALALHACSKPLNQRHEAYA